MAIWLSALIPWYLMRPRSWRPVSFALCTDHRLPRITQETLMMCFSSRNTDEESSMAKPQHFSQSILPMGEAGYIPGYHHLLSQTANICWIIKKKKVPEKHLLLFYWLRQSLWLCGSQQTVKNSSRDGNTRPPDLPLEKSVGRSGSNS